MQWEQYEEGVQKGTQSHDRLVEHSFPTKALVELLEEGKEEVQQVQDGTLDPTKCSICACPQGHNSRSRRAKAGSCEIVVSGKAACNQGRHFMDGDDCKNFKEMVDEYLPGDEQPLQRPQLLKDIRNRVRPFEDPPTSPS